MQPSEAYCRRSHRGGVDEDWRRDEFCMGRITAAQRGIKFWASLQHGRILRHSKRLPHRFRTIRKAFSFSLFLSLSLPLPFSRSPSLSLTLSIALESKRFAQAPPPTHSTSHRPSRLIRQPAPQTALAAQPANHNHGRYRRPPYSSRRDKNCTKSRNSSLFVPLDLPFFLPFFPSPFPLALVRTPLPPNTLT